MRVVESGAGYRWQATCGAVPASCHFKEQAVAEQQPAVITPKAANGQ
jgi:hypothetical protein